MDVSLVGSLSQNGNKEIKRRRKIQYRKPRGRLTQKASGILNKSICRKNLSLNEGNQSHLIMVKDVNSFLTKNRELAKALEESRCQAKELEKDKFTYQLECIEMREKLSIVHNAVLKCTCSKDNVSSADSLDMLASMKDTMQKSMSYLNDYMDALVADKVSKYSAAEDSKLSLIQRTNTSTEVGSQTVVCSIEHVPIRVVTKNKKLQVRMDKNDITSCNRKHIDDEFEESKEYFDKSTQCGNEIKRHCCEHKSVQCSLQTMNESYTKNRQALMVLKDINQTNTHQPKSIMKKNSHTLSHKTHLKSRSVRLPTIKIYEDSPNDDKENKSVYSSFSHENRLSKKVTIHSPAEIRIFDETLEQADGRLRQRRNTCYKEPSINRKLSRGDPTVDTRFYTSPHQSYKRKRSKKSRNKKPNMNKSIALEDIISMVEESFLANGAGTVMLKR